MSEIKNCPFCGRDDAFVERQDFASCYVQCNTCNCHGPMGMQRSDEEDEEMPGRPEAVELWNVRLGLQPSDGIPDPMQGPKRPSYFIGPAIEEHPAESALRRLASWLGAGGFNAPTVDAAAFEEKIRWGIENAIAERTGELQRTIDVLHRPAPPLRCAGCGKTIAEHGPLLNCKLREGAKP